MVAALPAARALRSADRLLAFADAVLPLLLDRFRCAPDQRLATVVGRALPRRLFGRVLFASLEERLELAFEFGNAFAELGVLGFEFSNPSVAGGSSMTPPICAMTAKKARATA